MYFCRPKVRYFLNTPHIVMLRPIARQRLSEHVPTLVSMPNNRTSIARQRISTNASLTIEAVFSAWSMQCGYKEVFSNMKWRTRAESGSSTSTVTLWVIGGNGKGSLTSEAVKYGREYQGARTRERLHWQGPAAYTKVRPVLLSETAPHKNTTVTVKQ
jgi:hypothetical protein